MGWTNYVIIPKFKLAIEISRYVEEIEEYRRNALEDAIEDENGELDEMDQVKLTEVTLKDLTILYGAYDKMQRIAGMEYDKLLLFWLEHRDIDYEIRSEHQVDLEEYKQKGYTIIRIFYKELSEEEKIVEKNTEKNSEKNTEKIEKNSEKNEERKILEAED